MQYGDIKLNGKDYLIIKDPGSYRVSDVTDFAPRGTSVGGSAVHAQLKLYQPYLQTDWRHGFGFQWYEDAMGYMRTEGNIDTRHSGIAMMFTKATSSDTDNNAKEGFCAWNSKLWAWGAGGLRSYASNTWSNVYNSGAVNFAFPAGDYLYYCPDGARIRKISTADADTTAGNDDNSTDYSWMAMYGGYLYAGKDGTNMIHRDSTGDLSDLEGTSADTNVIYVGAQGSFETLGASVYGGYLYTFTRTGLWQIGEDLIARRILDFSSEASDDNFRSVAVHNGYLLFPIRDKLYQWNGARLSDVTPPRISDSFPYTTYGRFDNFVSMGRFMYCTARTNETTYAEDLLCWDGVAWTKLMELVSNGTDTISAMGCDPINNRLWYHLNATADATYYIPFQSKSEFPYADFPTTGTHELILSRWDMGYRWVDKSTPEIIIESSNCSSSSYLTVSYALDGGSYIEWGNVYSNGITKIDIPDPDGSAEFKYLTLKIKFTTTSGTNSPILEGVTLRYIMRPDDIDGWMINIPVERGLEMANGTDNRTMAELVSDLKAARSSKIPVEFVDIDGTAYEVFVTALTRQLMNLAQDEQGEAHYELVATLNLVEND